MKYGEGRKYPSGEEPSHLFHAEKHLIDNIAAMTTVEGGADAEIVELLSSLRNAVKDASAHRTFAKVGRQYLKNVLYSIAIPPEDDLAFHLSELARELAKNGLLREGGMLAEHIPNALRLSAGEPSATSLLRIINNLFWIGFYLAKEKWFLEAVSVFRTYKKSLKKDMTPEEIENVLEYWLPVAEISDWNEVLHKLNFEIMITRFSRGEI